MRIFIVDDEEISCRGLKEMLGRIAESGGSEIYLFTDSENALTDALRLRPEVIFLDIVMPVKDGNAAITEIMEFDSNATIFVASSVGTQSELKKALTAGASDFIQKPIDKNQVINLINKHIGRD